MYVYTNIGCGEAECASPEKAQDWAESCSYGALAAPAASNPEWCSSTEGEGGGRVKGYAPYVGMGA